MEATTDEEKAKAFEELQISKTPVKDLVGQVSAEGRTLWTFEPTQTLIPALDYFSKGKRQPLHRQARTLWMCSVRTSLMWFGGQECTVPWSARRMTTRAKTFSSSCPKLMSSISLARTRMIRHLLLLSTSRTHNAAWSEEMTSFLIDETEAGLMSCTCAIHLAGDRRSCRSLPSTPRRAPLKAHSQCRNTASQELNNEI